MHNEKRVSNVKESAVSGGVDRNIFSEELFMDDRTRRYLEEKSKIFKALGHPTRLFIVEELARGERCVHDLTEMIGADISTVSRHLSVLKNARIISDDKRGAQVFYSLAVPCVINFFSCVDNVLDTVAEDIDAIREDRDAAPGT